MTLPLWPLVALGAGALAYLLTREVIVGVLVAGAALWLLRRRARAAPPDYPRPEPGNTRRALNLQERPTGTVVVCKQVTPLRQEWTSVKTGRLFDVLSQNGPPGAKPGDRGEVVSSSSGYRIRRLTEPEPD